MKNAEDTKGEKPSINGLDQTSTGSQKFLVTMTTPVPPRPYPDVVYLLLNFLNGGGQVGTSKNSGEPTGFFGGGHRIVKNGRGILVSAQVFLQVFDAIRGLKPSFWGA